MTEATPVDATVPEGDASPSGGSHFRGLDVTDHPPEETPPPVVAASEEVSPATRHELKLTQSAVPKERRGAVDAGAVAAWLDTVVPDGQVEAVYADGRVALRTTATDAELAAAWADFVGDDGASGDAGVAALAGDPAAATTALAVIRAEGDPKTVAATVDRLRRVEDILAAMLSPDGGDGT